MNFKYSSEKFINENSLINLLNLYTGVGLVKDVGSLAKKAVTAPLKLAGVISKNDVNDVSRSKLAPTTKKSKKMAKSLYDSKNDTSDESGDDND